LRQIGTVKTDFDHEYHFNKSLTRPAQSRLFQQTLP
jgi:hypothetical protein